MCVLFVAVSSHHLSQLGRRQILAFFLGNEWEFLEEHYAAPILIGHMTSLVISDNSRSLSRVNGLLLLAVMKKAEGTQGVSLHKTIPVKS